MFFCSLRFVSIWSEKNWDLNSTRYTFPVLLFFSLSYVGYTYNDEANMRDFTKFRVERAITWYCETGPYPISDQHNNAVEIGNKVQRVCQVLVNEMILRPWLHEMNLQPEDRHLKLRQDQGILLFLQKSKNWDNGNNFWPRLDLDFAWGVQNDELGRDNNERDSFKPRSLHFIPI